jgi:ABC-2 type transport system permease protein
MREGKMYKILNIAWNVIRLEFADRSTLVFFLILPVVFTFVIGAGLGGSQQSNPEGDRRFPVVIVDEDRSTYSELLGEIIASSEVIRPAFRTADEAERLFEEAQVAAVLTIPAGFQVSLEENRPLELGFQKHPTSSMSFAIEEGVRARAALMSSAGNIAHTSIMAAEQIRPFPTQVERQSYFDSAFFMALDRLQEPAVVVETTQSSLVTIQIPESFNQSSPGQLVTWTMITLLGASQVFVLDRIRGTLRRLLVSPTSKAAIISGKILGMLSIGLLQMVVLIGFGALVLGVNWGRSPGALALIVLSFGLAAVSLGVLLAAFARTTSQASWMTILFAMLFSALGGAWWPLEITPPAYQAAVQILPTTWAMKGFNDVIIRGQDIYGVLSEVGILLLFAAVFFIVGVKRLRFQ